MNMNASSCSHYLLVRPKLKRPLLQDNFTFSEGYWCQESVYVKLAWRYYPSFWMETWKTLSPKIDRIAMGSKYIKLFLVFGQDFDFICMIRRTRWETLDNGLVSIDYLGRESMWNRNNLLSYAITKIKGNANDIKQTCALCLVQLWLWCIP